MLFSDFKRIYEASPAGAAKVASQLSYIIMDCFGLLSSIYRYADFAYVGGGFGAGIHNINEAAVYGIPVVFGPRHKKFNEAAALIACGGAFSVASAAETDSVLSHLLADTAARTAAGNAADAYIKANVGATAKIMKDIFGITID